MPAGHLLKLRLSLMGRPVRNYTFDKPVISVGRDPGADVFVDNPGVSRDHFRLERRDTGDYELVDLGSANGTFVNDHMVNTSVVHNNDVVRFGKYTLWVGYELDRRTTPRDGTSRPPEPTGHTVVLSRAELGHILEHEPREPLAKVVPMAMPGAPASVASRRAPRWSWVSLVTGLLIGGALGAGSMWFLWTRR